MDIADKKARIGRYLESSIISSESFKAYIPCLDNFNAQCDGIVREPILYLSLYFKTYRAKYYELLQSVRDTGDFESWNVFLTTVLRCLDALEKLNVVKEIAEKERNKVFVYAGYVDTLSRGLEEF
ncbi:MAG: hypothetical protein KDC47_09395 [Flavobacteriaceae bacterium]|nr:hypothetical protein [Flavobacteriaceae bacterium]